MNIEKNQTENYIKKIDTDRQYMLTVLLRICKIFSNSNIYNLLSEMMNNKNLSINQKEKINIEVLNEIKMCENYVKELKENKLKNNYFKRNNNNINNNNIIFNNNSNNIDSKNSMNNISEALDKIYLKKFLSNKEFKMRNINNY